MEIRGEFKETLLDIIGVIFLVFGIGAIFNSFYIANSAQALWMCYIGITVIGFGILRRSSFIVMSQVYILAIPLIVWDIDFLYWLVFNSPLWGITDYFFTNHVFDIGKVISLQHLFSIPLAIYAVYLMGLKKWDAWKISFVQIVVVFILTYFLTSEDKNINCVFKSCANITLGLPYTLTWFLIFFASTALSVVVINRLILKKK